MRNQNTEVQFVVTTNEYSRKSEHPDGFLIDNDSLLCLDSAVLIDLVITLLQLREKRGIATRQDRADLAVLKAVCESKLSAEWATDVAWTHDEDEKPAA